MNILGILLGWWEAARFYGLAILIVGIILAVAFIIGAREKGGR